MESLDSSDWNNGESDLGYVCVCVCLYECDSFYTDLSAFLYVYAFFFSDIKGISSLLTTLSKYRESFMTLRRRRHGQVIIKVDTGILSVTPCDKQAEKRSSYDTIK